MKNKERDLRAPRLDRAARLALGLVFLLASLDKIVHPEGFARLVDNYHLIPEVLVPGLALVLPWIEAVCGLFLCAGSLTRGASLTLGLLLLVFMSALGLNLARGLNVDCGCFGTAAGAGHGLGLALARDAVLLALAAFVFWRETRAGHHHHS